MNEKVVELVLINIYMKRCDTCVSYNPNQKTCVKHEDFETHSQYHIEVDYWGCTQHQGNASWVKNNCQSCIFQKNGKCTNPDVKKLFGRVIEVRDLVQFGCVYYKK